MSASTTSKGRQNSVMSLTEPLSFIFLSSLFIPSAIIRAMVTRDWPALFHWINFRHYWHAHFMSVLGKIPAGKDFPVLKPLMIHANGVVLDIGPGSGELVKLFESDQVTKVYGIEPNVKMHPKLQVNIKKSGLADIYEIVGKGAEELDLEAESVDTILTSKVLCSVPDQEQVIRDLYRYLKVGGKFIFLEHVKHDQEGSYANAAAKYQGVFDVSYCSTDLAANGLGILNYIWPTFFDGCSLTRRTGDVLCTVVEWRNIEIHKLDSGNVYSMMPEVAGVLTK